MSKIATFQLLEEHYAKYPNMQIQDLVKLLYQKEFGPGHMIEREEKSLANLISEWNQMDKTTISKSPSIMTEEIGNDLLRIFLDPIEESLLPILNKLFVQTANHTKGSMVSFQEDLTILEEFCLRYYPAEAVNTYFSMYKEEGYPVKGHSQIFRTTYSPSYRVIHRSGASFLSLIMKINKMLQQKEYLTIAIDGNCASGKTELSLLLSDYFNCNIIHMDDFFLPPELRTSERMMEAGGNIHYERFQEEIIANWKPGNPISYRRFSCKKMDYQEQITLLPKKLTIVEGSYSQRTDFSKIYDYTIFLTCSEEVQTERIRKRNGEEMLQIFVNKWIPMENKYFRECKSKDLCDEIINT